MHRIETWILKGLHMHQEPVWKSVTLPSKMVIRAVSAANAIPTKTLVTN